MKTTLVIRSELPFQNPVQADDLFDNLPRRKIALQTVEPACTELAPDRAANLRADAGRPPRRRQGS